MRVTILSVPVKAFILLIILGSCQPQEQKSSDAFDRFKEDKMTKKDCVLIMAEEPKIIAKAEPLKATESQDEWMKFKNEIEKKILLNENRIKKIKQTPEADVKLFKKVIHLEKENEELKIQLTEYEEEVKLNLKKFKEKINFQVKDIDVKFNDMSIQENKK